MLTGAIKAVVFDWAGTMVDFGCMAPVDALIDAFAGEGVAITRPRRAPTWAAPSATTSAR